MLRVILALVTAVSLTYGLLQHWEAQERQVLLTQLNTQSIGALERERRARGDLDASLKRQMELEENVARLTAERDEALSKLKETGGSESGKGSTTENPASVAPKKGG